MIILLHLAVLTATVLLLERLVPSVKVRNVTSAIVVAVTFSLLNFFLGWFIKVVMFVPAILTLGLLFLIMPFIVNTILLWLTDKLIGSFEIETMGGLLFSAGAITFVNAIFYMAVNAHQMGLYGPGPTRWI
jgi:putative membrane protein